MSWHFFSLQFSFFLFSGMDSQISISKLCVLNAKAYQLSPLRHNTSQIEHISSFKYIINNQKILHITLDSPPPHPGRQASSIIYVYFLIGSPICLLSQSFQTPYCNIQGSLWSMIWLVFIFFLLSLVKTLHHLPSPDSVILPYQMKLYEVS